MATYQQGLLLHPVKKTRKYRVHALTVPVFFVYNVA